MSIFDNSWNHLTFRISLGFEYIKVTQNNLNTNKFFSRLCI